VRHEGRHALYGHYVTDVRGHFHPEILPRGAGGSGGSSKGAKGAKVEVDAEKWFCHDDISIYARSQGEVFGGGAQTGAKDAQKQVYMLFYELRE
jgi:hypothetical protein